MSGNLYLNFQAVPHMLNRRSYNTIYIYNREVLNYLSITVKSTAEKGVRMLTLLLEQGWPGSSKYNGTGPHINPGR